VIIGWLISESGDLNFVKITETSKNFIVNPGKTGSKTKLAGNGRDLLVRRNRLLAG